jgi:hypothetical protein
MRDLLDGKASRDVAIAKMNTFWIARRVQRIEWMVLAILLLAVAEFLAN